MAHLRPCTTCARHVRANVTACPFCDAPLALDTTSPAAPQERLGRAALMAFGGAAALALSVAACDKPKENIAMPYGAPPERTVPEAADGSTPVATATATASATAATTTTPVAGNAADPAADAGTKATPKPSATAKPTATAVRANQAKPYGAPPADGYDVFEV